MSTGHLGGDHIEEEAACKTTPASGSLSLKRADLLWADSSAAGNYMSANWTCTDQSWSFSQGSAKGVSVMVPLVDLASNSAELEVITASHRDFDSWKLEEAVGPTVIQVPFTALFLSARAARECCQCLRFGEVSLSRVPALAGDILVLDNRTWHRLSCLASKQKKRVLFSRHWA